MALIRAFFVREALDYNPVKDSVWIDAAVKEFEKTIRPIKDSDYIHITSSHCMTEARALKLDAFRGKSRHNYEVHLCNCGNLKHLLSVRRLN